MLIIYSQKSTIMLTIYSPCYSVYDDKSKNDTIHNKITDLLLLNNFIRVIML